jgi:ATP-binding cassette subfamily B protein
MSRHKREFNIPSLTQLKKTAIVSFRLFKLVWSVDPVLLVISFVTSLVPAVLPFIIAYIGKLLIDFVVAAIAGKAAPLSHLYFLIGLGLGIYFLQSVVQQTQQYVNTLLWTKLPISLNQLIFEKTAGLDMQYFEDSQFKDLLQKVRESYNFRTQQHIQNLFYFIQSVLQVSIAAIALVHLNIFLLAAIILIAIPEFLNDIQQSRLAYGIWDANTKFRKRYWYLSNLLQVAWSVKEVKLFSLGNRFLKEVEDIQTKFYDDNAALAKRTYIINIILSTVSVVFLIGIQFFVIIQALQRRITIGDINFYQSVISNFQNGLGGLFNNLNRIFDNSQYVQSIFDLFDTHPLITEIANPVQLHLTKPPLIEFKNVSFSYPDKKEKALKNFNLTIHPGEKVAFVGENGAGKSTIIKLLARFYDVTEGEILINGTNIKALSLASWYQTLGILFQDFNRYEDTVKDNIAYGDLNKEARDEVIEKAARDSGANSFITTFDNTYQQMLGRTFEEGLELSTGQWQKLALARAFFRDAKVLILDEPTAAIDPKAEAEIFDKVDKLSQDRTVIIISHRFSTVRNADTIYVINNGSIQESGNHKELMKKQGQYAKLFSLQASRYQ